MPTTVPKDPDEIPLYQKPVVHERPVLPPRL